MKRAATVLAVAAIGTSVSAGGAFAATTKWDVMVTGTFKTKAAATKEITKLKAKKLTGFKAVKSGKTYKVERVFTTHKKANSELARLKKDGFKGKVAKG